MKFLNNTSIRTRIVTIALIPLLVITWLSYERYKSADEEKENLAKIETALVYFETTSILINLVQEERNLAMVMTGSDGMGYLNDYEKSIQQSDQQIQKFHQLLKKNNSDLNNIPGFQKKVSDAVNNIVEMKLMRQYVRTGNFYTPEGKFTLVPYTKVVGSLARSSQVVVLLAAEDRELSLLSNSYFNLMMGKEAQNLNVGILLRILTEKNSPFSRYNRFFMNGSLSNIYFNNFKAYAPNDIRQAFVKEYDDSKSSKTISKATRKLKKDRETEVFTPEQWFKVSGERRAILTKLDNLTRENMMSTVKLRYGSASDKVKQTIIAFLALMVFNCLLVFFIVRSILQPLETLVSNFMRIAKTKNLDHLTPVIGKDEFATASGAFNVLIVNLREKNADIQAMLTNMRQGLFTVGIEGNVQEEYSQYLEKIFQKEDLCGINAVELLFEGSDLGNDVLNQIQETLNSVIGEDEINFEFNKHLLVEEVDKQIDGEIKTLALEWNPIVEDDIVEKLMITVRDITQIKAMQAEVAEKAKELQIVGQLLNIASAKFKQYVSTAKDFIEENKNIIEHGDFNAETVDLLFRNMHTIKGNSRTYGFKYMCDVTHEAESVYTQLKSNPDQSEPDFDNLLVDLQRVDEVLDEYLDIYQRVLGRDKSSDRDEGGLWMGADKIEAMKLHIAKIEDELKSVGKSGLCQDIIDMIDKGVSVTLEDMLQDLTHSLPSLAEELGKPPAKIQFNDNGIRLHKKSEELICNIFTHLLRNSIDHGIECAQERIDAGKNAFGTIQLCLSKIDDQVAISLSDDGKGLNLQALHKKGVEAGLWQSGEQIEIERIADLIFRSGTSTKESVSEISGRGVGMDAVKQFIERKNGSINLNFLENSIQTYNGVNDKSDESFVSFELVICIPDELSMESKAAA